MKFQTDPKLMFNAKSDCFVFCILKIHEIVGNHEFTYDQLKKIRRVAVRPGFHGKDGYINEKSISGIASVASGLTGHHIYIKRTTSNDPFNFLIGEFMRIVSDSKRFTHFNLMKDLSHKVVEFDPWSEEGARTTEIGNIIGYRYIWAEAI